MALLQLAQAGERGEDREPLGVAGPHARDHRADQVSQPGRAQPPDVAAEGGAVAPHQDQGPAARGLEPLADLRWKAGPGRNDTVAVRAESRFPGPGQARSAV